jgi:3-hydroxyisobutyrate dehydrogenase-like beta-hydroxyacid dehydrogenase
MAGSKPAMTMFEDAIRNGGTAMKIGFIGVGNIGAPIAGQLLKAGYPLLAHDIRRSNAEKLLAAGAIWADAPAALAAECDVVATCLPGPTEMEAVCLGPAGIAAHLKPGALYIDHTTNAPSLVRRVHSLLARRNIAMLDAPVSGGMEGAQTRDLLVMAGGDDAAFACARPLLDAIAKRVIHTGAIGTGSVAKIMHNCASFTLDMLLAECWTTGVKAGIDAATIVRVFNEAALGQQMSMKVRLPATYLRGDFDPRFSLALAKKDLGLAMDLARETKTPMRLAALCEQELTEAMARGWAGRDASIALTLQEERAGIEVRLPPR